MKAKKLLAQVTQKLEFDRHVAIEPCPDKEFSDLDCVKIGDEYFLPSIEWTKYVPAHEYSDDGAGGFDAVEGADWETIHHAIVKEQTQIKKS